MLYMGNSGICQGGGTDLHPFFSSPVDNGKVWTQLEAPPGLSQGPVSMGFDADHQVLYGSLCGDGVWRVVAPIPAL
jgi:hypothetical protein